ncbi:MAG: MaoC family dehydratase N-terminal domain-containing protein [Deltaproteobacteria bacterium]|nr:MaoC family dehydratase N-terminal domain-containing protein [Deltaproteobacteria bacterium]
MKKRIVYFEEIEVGERGETCGRTFTEGELVQFAGLSGDFCPPHMDLSMMSQTGYGERIAHGFFTNSLATGLLSWHAPYLTGRDTSMAYLRSLTSRFPVGLRVGDTIRFHWSIKEKIEDHDLPGLGIVKVAFQFVNQQGGIAAEGEISAGIRMRGAEGLKPQFRPGEAWDYEEWDPDFDKVHYYEDFTVGKGEKSGGRVVTEADVVSYMSLMGDYDRVYTDPDYAKESLYGERIVPPMLVADFVGMSLRDCSYFNLKKPFVPYAGHLGDDITFIAPARIGDTLYTILKIESARISKTKPDRGVQIIGHQVVNQRNEALVDIRLATTVPVRAAMKTEVTETMWVLHEIKR